ncbi:hypothetical protein [Citrobacter portucalensis]|uniref:hypothetical protein n=1 Tax=Citrobacter portucalensis TaxID=1639133 RepID=UPI00255198D8|nr:hypothetical protein [Citrobacter portucalensis]
MTTFTHAQIVSLIDIDVFKTPARDSASRKKRIEEGKKLKAEYDKGSFSKTAAVKAILEVGGKVDAVQMNKLLGITTKKRVSGATEATQSTVDSAALQQELEQLRERLKAAEALNALVPVIASKENQSSVLAQITAEEQAKELADIQRYAEERKQQTEKAITKQMRLVFPDYSPNVITSVVEETTQALLNASLDYSGLSIADKKVCIDRSYTQDNIDKYRLDVWQSKVEGLDPKLRTEAKKVIGVDWNDWKMIKKVYEDITKTKS